MIEFRVAGLPATQGSKRAIINRHTGRPVILDDANKTSAKRLESWRESVGVEARRAQDFHGKLEPGVPLRLTLRFYMPRPMSAPKRVLVPVTRPDLLKLGRAVEDAMTGVLYHDDSQIVQEALSKDYASSGWTGVAVKLEAIA